MSTVAVSQKLFSAYLKARRSQQRDVFGGVTFNDHYNRRIFGLTKEQHDVIHTCVVEMGGDVARADVNRFLAGEKVYGACIQDVLKDRALKAFA